MIAAAATALGYLQRASVQVQRQARRVALRMRIAQLANGIDGTVQAVFDLCPTDGAHPLPPEERDELLALVRYGKRLQALHAEAVAEAQVLDMQIAASRREARS